MRTVPGRLPLVLNRKFPLGKYPDGSTGAESVLLGGTGRESAAPVFAT
ncbi:hypothetical protein VA596_03705 [Amycolatopsis sp., V23-08]|uniref:Uncharacterized protein n=1 Tax=Amycolatopsis heterodermiae TaxID=3110235 RepID=A0ABU5QYR1_9PSEU|nr:hypothetical protein [Amycolatopsis sp., V23-08]MEA5358629.1 hypothetical protein [Amycolatopsis sp., V23-08]